ncbi:hypothetical protein QU577_18365 [Priestia megaterium]|uniref:hypothetical protein n=1 Tax=Priestia megaterium TaxID=1404 RepID=UPI0025B22D57|nr:hypothetical protein [Priestia megaterium]MDN3363733.1 hypothetical protein [Priestia megaterium]
MKKKWLYTSIACAFVLLSGCSSDIQLESIKRVTDSTIKNSILDDYLSKGTKSLSYSYDGEGEGKYKINIVADVDSAFYDNNPLGIFNILSRTTEGIGSDLSNYCGNTNCEFGTLTVSSSKGDSYSMNINNKDGDETLVHNDEKIKREDLLEYKDPDSVPPDEEYSEKENVSISDDAVYEFMENQLDQMTNGGQNYVPEIHCEKAIKATTKRFNLTVDEVVNIYISKANIYGSPYINNFYQGDEAFY